MHNQWPRLNGQATIKRLLTFALSSLLYQRGWADDRGIEELDAWFAEYERLGKALGAAEINQEAWQDGMDQLFRGRRPTDLLERINFPAICGQLTRDITPERGELFHMIALDGRPVEHSGAVEPARVLITKIAYVQRGRSIPPHGHSNMVSAFLQLSGEFRVRQFNKLADEANALVVQPSVDFTGGAGLWSSISDSRNNVHWLSGKSDDCFLLTTKLIQLHDGKPFAPRINIDLRNATSAGGSSVRALKISAQRAAELYDESRVARNIQASYQVGKTVSMAKNGTGSTYLGFGCSHQEKDHRWTEGERASIILYRAGNNWSKERGLRLTMLASAYGAQHVELKINGAVVDWRQVSGSLEEVVFLIPASLVESRRVEIIFVTPEAKSPSALGLSADTRKLGLAVYWFRIDVAETAC